MPGKDKLGIRSSSDSGPQISCAETPLGVSWSSFLDCSFSSGSPAGIARVETQVASIIMKKHVQQWKVSAVIVVFQWQFQFFNLQTC